MNKINNFKELERLALKKHTDLDNSTVQRNIQGTLGIFQFIGSLADLFFSKFIGAALGTHELGNTKKAAPKYPNNND